jgi:hypothetical protein
MVSHGDPEGFMRAIEKRKPARAGATPTVASSAK